MMTYLYYDNDNHTSKMNYYRCKIDEDNKIGDAYKMKKVAIYNLSRIGNR